MNRSIPSWLDTLRANLDLKRAPGQPTGVARLLLMILLADGGDAMLVSAPIKRLSWLTDADESLVRRALRLLVHRKAIERVSHHSGAAWRILLASDATADNPSAGARVFWPVPPNWGGEDQTKAIRTLLSALGNRNRVAVIFLLYQFSRPPELPGCFPLVPNQTWTAGVLGTSVHTVYRAKLNAIQIGIATEHEDGLLAFADPGSWSEILRRRTGLAKPATHTAPTKASSIPTSSAARAPEGPESSSERSAPPSWEGGRLPSETAANLSCRDVG